MGTKATMEFKIKAAMAMVQKAHDQKQDIDREKFISTLMIDLYCERRKAIELMNAVLTRFNYKEEKLNGRKIFTFQEA